MQEAATPLVDTIAGEQLALSGTGGPDLSIAGYPGRNSMRFDGTLQQAAHSLATFMDIDANTSFSIALAFKLAANPTDYRGIFGKREENAPQTGYAVSFTASGGFSSIVDSGTPIVAWEDNSISYGDNLDHGMFWVHDESADEMRIHTDKGNHTSPSTASVLSLANTATFRFGLIPGTSLSSDADLRISYAAMWVGTALTAADFAKWWTP